MRKIIAACMIMLLCGCSVQPEQRSVFAMDTIMALTVYGSREAADGAVELLYSLEEAWSVTDEGSEIFRLNSAGEGELTAATAELIEFALDMNGLTEGALDITMYPVLREWGFTTGEYCIPSEQRTAELLGQTGCEKVRLDGSYAVLTDGVQLDLGAVAKGYAGDLLAEYLRGQGVDSALLDLGGNIHALGTNPDGGAWRLGVRNPFGNGNAAVLELSDMAAVTSGGYERYFIGEDGKRYCHILDPKTGRPADSGLASVTIVGAEGRLCDALSTAVYVLGAQRGLALHKSIGGFEMLLITNDGNMLITEGMQQLMSAAKDFSGTVEVLR